MKYKIIFSMLIFSLLIISACVVEVPEEGTPIEKQELEEVIEEEVEEPVEEVPEEKEMSLEVKELLGIADEKVQSLRYSYKGPETDESLYKFVMKGNNVKYVLDPPNKPIDAYEDAYDTIYLDTELKTAQAYCDDRKCKVKGKKADLGYDEVYIWTPLDWLDNIEFAEKVGEELIDRRNTWKLSTKNLGTMWVDSFFGVPLQVEFDENKYQFMKMVFNDVKDEEVIPKD